MLSITPTRTESPARSRGVLEAMGYYVPLLRDREGDGWYLTLIPARREVTLGDPGWVVSVVYRCRPASSAPG